MLSTSTSSRRLAMAIIAAFTVLVFWETQYYSFFVGDDDGYVYSNTITLGGLTPSGIWSVFTGIHVANYHPLTMVSLMADREFFGPDASGFHRTNLALHVTNTLLLFAGLHRMTSSVWRSAFAAALFAIHPLHVEPVVWISSRKDVLSTTFMLLSIGAYCAYAKSGARRQYALTAILMLCGLLSKQMLVTLPFVLCLLDYWPLNRIDRQSDLRTVRRLLIEKAPFFGLSIVFVLITLWAQREGGALRNLEDIPLYDRLKNTPVAYIAYMLQTIVPVKLQVIGYQIPLDLPLWKSMSAILLLAGITAGCLWRLKPDPYLIVGWLFYLGTLLPVSGLVTIGGTYRADRYAYVPLIGLFVMVAWGGAKLAERIPSSNRTRIAQTIAGVVIVTYSIVAWNQVGKWNDSVTLLSETVANDPNHLAAHFSLGNAYLERGNFAKAVEQYVLVLKRAPNFGPANIKMGVIQVQLGNYQRAERFYELGLETDPEEMIGLIGLGYTKIQLGKTAEAAELFRRALEINPKNQMARTELERLEQGVLR